MEHVVACLLGRLDYAPAWALQQRVQAHLIAAKRADAGRSATAPPPHVLLLVEHPHVFTLGKNGSAAHLLLSEDALAARGATFYHVDRGGDITYHGPGQMVGYPILDLDRFFTDIHRYLRTLEDVVIDTCADYGVAAGRVEGRTGVWVGPDARGPERKICAMGIRSSRWVTLHGFAFNLNTDLSMFGCIVPCGITDRGVTSLAVETGRAADEAEVRARLLAHFADRFEVRLTVLDGARAFDFLDAFTAAPETC